MTDTLELELRAAMADRSASRPIAEVVERLRQINYPTSSRRPRLNVRRTAWPVLSAAAVALIAGIAITVVLTASPATPAAYAGWTPTPRTPTRAQLTAATRACNNSLRQSQSPTGIRALPNAPVLSDQRGKFTAQIFITGTDVWDCVSDGHNNGGTNLGGNAIQLTSYARPGPRQLGLPAGTGGSLKGFLGGNPNQPLPPQWRYLLNTPLLKDHPGMRARMEASFRAQLASGTESNREGLTGRDIATVTFVFKNGTTVDATVQNGWYFAWWPDVYATPTSVRVTTTSGAEQSCSYSRTTGCVWAGFKPQRSGDR